MNEPKICIIGAGQLSGRRIYPYIGAAGGVLVGSCDLDQDKAEERARRFGGTAYTDVNTMLDQEKPDGVIICVSAEVHAMLAPELMRRGIPVYTEKPPAPTAEDAYKMVQVSRETGVACVTGFKKRYAKAYQRASEWLSGYAPEDQMSVSIDYASGHYTNKDSRSSLLLDFGVHAIDLFSYLFGDVEKVFAFQKDQHAYAVTLKFTSGAVGTLTLNDGRSFSIPTEEMEISLQGGNFMTIHNSSSWRITENMKQSEWYEPPTFTSAGDSGENTGHMTELLEFITSIGSKQRLRSDIYESYKSLVLYEAVRDAAESGEVVEVSYLK